LHAINDAATIAVVNKYFINYLLKKLRSLR